MEWGKIYLFTISEISIGGGRKKIYFDGIICQFLYEGYNR